MTKETTAPAAGWHTFRVEVRATKGALVPPDLAQVAFAMRDLLRAEEIEVYQPTLARRDGSDGERD